MEESPNEMYMKRQMCCCLEKQGQNWREENTSQSQSITLRIVTLELLKHFTWQPACERNNTVLTHTATNTKTKQKTTTKLPVLNNLGVYKSKLWHKQQPEAARLSITPKPVKLRDSHHSFLLLYYYFGSLPIFTRQTENLPAFGSVRVLMSGCDTNL